MYQSGFCQKTAYVLGMDNQSWPRRLVNQHMSAYVLLTFPSFKGFENNYVIVFSVALNYLWSIKHVE